MTDETPNYEQLFDRFLDAFDFDDIPEDERADFFSEIGDVLVEGILTEAALALPDEYQEELEALIGEVDVAHTPEETIDAQERLFVFLEEHVPGFTDIVATQGAELIESYQATKEEYGVLDDDTSGAAGDASEDESLDEEEPEDTEDSFDDKERE